jgi:hypothetical protein
VCALTCTSVLIRGGYKASSPHPTTSLATIYSSMRTHRQ